MAGHSHWAGIKHQKAIADAKRGKSFSKLLAAISAAARTEPDPDFNPRLRSAIERAKQEKVPAENIQRAIRRAAEPGAQIEELLFEAYGPGGAALCIEMTTANRNRAVQEVKKILSERGGKWAEAGSVLWAFEKQDGDWRPKFPASLTEADQTTLAALAAALEEHEGVQRVITNAT